jgi:hypothetical protein
MPCNFYNGLKVGDEIWYNLSMDGFIWGGIIILSAVVFMLLQISSGVLITLYGEKQRGAVPKKRKSIVEGYLTGVWVMILLLLAAVCYLVSNFTAEGKMTSLQLGVMTALLLLGALTFWLVYYRRDWLGRNRGAELWIPKPAARELAREAKECKTAAGGFRLGLVVELLELPFSVILLFVAADAILELAPEWQLLVVVLYSLLAIMPLLFIRFSIKRGKNVEELQRWRENNKTFLRIVTGIGFVVLAAFIYMFKVIGV